jgi:hypothetical protein
MPEQKQKQKQKPNMPRKKKTDVIMSAEISETMEMPGTIGSAKLVFPKEPIVVKGNHLTVTTFPDGSTKLEWDDDALLREVQNAILKAESTIPAGLTTQEEVNGKTRKTRKSK